MSILSTNKKLISIGAEYSAGQGIDITNHVISVVESAVGTNYSAGPNINIYDDEGQPTISSKDWSSEIADASANAYEQAIAQIPEPQDLSYLSGRIDTNTSGIDYISSVCLTAHQDWTDTIKGASSYSYEQSTSYFDNWISGQYTGDITNITNKVTSISGNFDNYYKKTETSSKDEINDALQYVSANAGKVYEGVSPIVVNNTEDKISADTWTFSAGSNVSFVDDNVNKITRIDVELPTPQDLSYISAQTDKANQGVDYLSGVVITALPSDMATTGDVAELAQTISETYQTKGDYLVRSDSANFYPANNPSGFITGVDLSNYYTKDETSGKEELANAFANIPVGDPEVNAYVTSNSASIDESTNLVQSNSSTWNDVTAYQSNSASYLTAIDIPESATWNDVSETVQTNSAQWADGGAGDEEVNSFVYNNSATINEVNTTYQENSGTYLTAVDLTPYQTTEGMTAYQPVSSMTSYANRFQLISVSSNLSAAIHSLDESITTGVVGDLYNYDVKGLNLYGVTSTSSFPSTGYVPSFSSNVTTHNSDGQGNVFSLSTANMSQWNGKPYVSISSNGNYITDNYKCKVFYLFDSIANKSWQSQNPFSGEIGTLDKDNLIVYNNYVKPSYFTNNGISNFNAKLVFSSNDGGYHPFDVVLTFGDLGVTATNTISGIFVPSAVDLSNYYTKSETSGANQIKNALNSVLNYTTGTVQYVQSNSSRTDFVVESYFTSAGSFLDCYETVNANSGDWGGGNPEVENYVQTNSGMIDETITSYQTNSSTYMVEPNLEYNAVGEISGYGSSAIAQYGAEKQWLVHDGTLCHLSNSAQYALGVNVSALQRLMGIDETVIYENTTGASVNSANVITLNETLQNFEIIKIIDNSLAVGGTRRLTIIPVSTATRSIATNDAWFDVSYNPTGNGSKYIGVNFYSANDAGTQIRMNGSYVKNMAATGAWTNRNDGHLFKIVGVHRISD